MTNSAGLEALFVRLYFDRHLMARLALDLRGRGFDVLRTEEAGQDTASDEEQLAFATAENRAPSPSTSAISAHSKSSGKRLVALMPASSCRSSSAAANTGCCSNACCASSITSPRRRWSATSFTWSNASRVRWRLGTGAAFDRPRWVPSCVPVSSPFLSRPA